MILDVHFLFYLLKAETEAKVKDRFSLDLEACSELQCLPK